MGAGRPGSPETETFMTFYTLPAREQTLFNADGLGTAMAEEEGGGSGPLTPRWKAFGISLAVNLVCLPLVLVLTFVWPVVILAIVPYIAGALGGRHVDRRTGMLTGALAAGIMATVLVSILFYALSIMPGEGFDPLEPIGLSLVIAGYFTALLFGALGGRHGAIAMEDAED